jgi:hypothetical protein
MTQPLNGPMWVDLSLVDKDTGERSDTQIRLGPFQ